MYGAPLGAGISPFVRPIFERPSAYLFAKLSGPAASSQGLCGPGSAAPVSGVPGPVACRLFPVLWPGRLQRVAVTHADSPSPEAEPGSRRVQTLSGEGCEAPVQHPSRLLFAAVESMSLKILSELLPTAWRSQSRDHPCRRARPLRRHPEAELVLVARPEVLSQVKHWQRVHLVEASEVVTMDDPVEVACARSDSSMRVAIAR